MTHHIDNFPPHDDYDPPPNGWVSLLIWFVVIGAALLVMWTYGCNTTSGTGWLQGLFNARGGDKATDTSITGGGVDSITSMILAAGYVLIPIGTIAGYILIWKPIFDRGRKAKMLTEARTDTLKTLAAMGVLYEGDYPGMYRPNRRQGERRTGERMPDDRQDQRRGDRRRA